MKIKRPLFIFALSVLVVINMINTLPGSIFYCSLAMFVLYTIIHRVTVNKYTHHLTLVLLAAVFAIGGFAVFKNNLNNKMAYFSSKESIVIEGTVVNKDNTSYANSFHIAVNKADGEKISNFKVIVYSDEYLDEGDRVVMAGKYKSFTPTSNYIYNYSQGVFGYFYADNIAVVSKDNGIISGFSRLRTALTDKSRKIFDYDTVSLAVAMGFGDKSLLDKSVTDSFRYTGTSHAVVVSGLHIGFIVAVLTALMYCLPVYKRAKNIVLCVLLLIFMGIIGFTPSVIRAGCLIISITLGKTFLVETDNYTVLAVVVLLTLMLNPYSANNGSLLLSYSAYFGVVQAAEICSKNQFGKIKSMLLMSVFASLYTTPVLSMLGMNITLLSPLFNLVLTYVIMVICILSFFLPVIAFIPFIGTPTAAVFAPVNDIFIRILLRVSQFAEQQLSFALIDLDTTLARLLIVSIVLAVVIAFIQFESKRNRTIFILAVPIISLLCYNFLYKDVVTVKVFDGSSEPSYIVESKEKTTLIATENINASEFEDILKDLSIEKLDNIVVCSLKEVDTQLYLQYTENLNVISKTEKYTDDSFEIDSFVAKRQMACVIDIDGVRFGFNHNKADMSDKNLDFYFFGSSAPKSLKADNCFYFYPVIKKNVDLVTDKQAMELYNILEIKIKNGKYSIVEDIKNFGGRI